MQKPNELQIQKIILFIRLYTVYSFHFQKRVKIMLLMSLFLSQVIFLTIPKVESTSPSSNTHTSIGMRNIYANDTNIINVALNADVTLNGGSFFVGGGLTVSENTLVDGVFLPRGTQWDQGSIWWVSSDNVDRYIIINLGYVYRIESVIVQADDNDSYLLYYRDMKNSGWKLACHIPNYDMYLDQTTMGMQTRPNPNDDSMRYVLPQQIVTDELMLRGAVGEGDRRFSVSEIQAFSRNGVITGVFGDAVPPKISLFSLFDSGDISWNGEVKVFATYSDNVGVDSNSVRLKVDGGNVTSGVSASPYSLWYRVNLFPGSHTLELTLSDVDGNFASRALSITVIPLIELGIIVASILLGGFMVIYIRHTRHNPRHDVR
jgi:hypothetical protein